MMVNLRVVLTVTCAGGYAQNLLTLKITYLMAIWLTLCSSGRLVHKARA